MGERESEKRDNTKERFIDIINNSKLTNLILDRWSLRYIIFSGLKWSNLVC
jgi:hypothetical protein